MLLSRLCPLLPRPTAVSALRPLHTSSVSSGRNSGRKMRKVNPQKQLRLSHPRLMKMPTITPQAKQSGTEHPEGVADYKEEEERRMTSIAEASLDDQPMSEEQIRAAWGEGAAADPYAREPVRCLLCPKRYAVDVRPNYKNPKLLAQFVSPHTGLVYQKHITGLCEFMQKEVEREVRRAQTCGFLATKMKELHYLKDPALFDATRPGRKNPY